MIDAHPKGWSVERLAVQRRAAVCGRPSAATACWAALAIRRNIIP